ncbi:MAG: agmatinase [Chloroflexi bacterium]|nr:agmatinase [Chloroflexota bacterium]
MSPPDERFYPPHSFGALPAEYTAFDRARVAILPVPYDSTTTARAGARDGPAAIIAASADMELYDVGLGFEPYRWGIHTLPELAPLSGDAGATIARVEQVVAELAEAGKFVVTLGGEHTVAVGAARAHAARTPGLSVLAIDAHADMRDSYLGSPYNHACTLRRISEVVLPPGRITQVGLRSAEAEEFAYIRERGFAYYQPRDYRALPNGPREVVAHLSQDVYLTIDLDGIDPSQMAAVGTPEPGGLLWDELVELLAAVVQPAAPALSEVEGTRDPRPATRPRRIVGFDVTELAPDEGPRACAQLAAKLAYRLIGLALGPPGEA